MRPSGGIVGPRYRSSGYLFSQTKQQNLIRCEVVIVLAGTPWRLWAQLLTSMLKAELNQVVWIFAITLQYFCNLILHFCNMFHLNWGSTELLWSKKRYALLYRHLLEIHLFTIRHKHSAPTYRLWSKRITSQKKGPNRPPWLKKRHVTNMEPHPTF